MRRYCDYSISFEIDTACDTFSMSFSSDWSVTSMLDYMCDTFAIDKDSIIETRCIYVRRYKLSKDA